ncbi:MAG: HlyC/CorC family transporter [Deltaproteobacteria bacterium]|nr:MAG: HlyC/CorC family transporter [Deltaproteobacteria bacterium]
MGIEVIFLIVFCLLMEGLFTGSEIAVISVDRGYLKEMAASGRRFAKIGLEMLEKPERIFATSLTGTDLFVVANTIIFTTFFLERLESYAEIVSIAVLTPLVLIFGEIIPKSVFQTYSKRLAPFAIYFLHGASYVLAPAVAFLSTASRVFLRVFRVDVPARLGITREELIMMATQYSPGEDVEEHEQKMVGRVFEYSEKKVRDVMVPLVDVVAFEETTPISEVIDVASVRGFTRYPIFRERIYNITGFVNVLDAFSVDSVDLPVSVIKRKPYFVPETMMIDELLEEMKREGQWLAIAVDEFGGVTGIITVEDILEEVVGEIEDEYDRGRVFYTEEGDGTLLISGRMEVEDLEELFDLEFPRGDYTTVAGYIIGKAGRIPQEGEIIEEGELLFEVVRATEKTVDLVRVKRREDVAGEEDRGDS